MKETCSEEENFEIEDYHSHDWDLDADEEEEPADSFVRLDENGLPSSSSFHLSSPEAVDDEVSGNGGNDNNLNGNGYKWKDMKQLPILEDEEENSFASDFYRCGTDWSFLISNCSSTSTTASTSNINNWKDDENNLEDKKKRLKQTNLFQMWNLPSKFKDDFSASPSLPPNKKVKKSNKAFLSSSTTTTTTNNGGQKQPQPRACPFYKKIPGMVS